MGAIDRLVSLAPNIEPHELETHYHELMGQLGYEMGIHYTVILRQELLDTLDAQHPLRSAIDTSGLAGDEFMLDKSHKRTSDGRAITRSMVLDQGRGVLDVFAQVGDQQVLLASFPGNGGDPRAGTSGKATKDFASTRAGEFRIKQLEHGYVSLSWRNSLIPQDAQIRLVDEEVMYAEEDGKFRYATGPQAEFAGRTPFDGNLTAADRQLLVSAGDVHKVSRDDLDTIAQIKDIGGWLVRRGETRDEYVTPMVPFTVDDFTDENGQLVSNWGKNEFGPRSIIYETEDGQRSPQLFHSNYLEEAGSTFLETSHGCIHMY